MDVYAKHVVYIQHSDDYIRFLEHSDFASSRSLVLGGGSNVLFTQDFFDGYIIVNRIKGKEIIEKTSRYTVVKVGAGEVWHDFVLWCVEQGLGGVENLALIPGCVGGAPIQNIGAYGVEVKSVIVRVKGTDISGKFFCLSNSDCEFGYRDSIFKRALKDKVFITHVVFRLHHADYEVNYSYASLKEDLEKNGIRNPGIRDIAESVMRIRRSKLPDPEKTGNAGSFFKNPVLSPSEYENFKKVFLGVPAYPSSEEEGCKIPAAWLIEKAGFKGKTWKGAAVHERQPLVLINYQNARGSDVWELAQQIQEKVKSLFGISLEPEVNIIR